MGTQREGLASRRAELVARIKDDLGGAMSAELEATILRGACTAQRAAAGRQAGCVPAGGWQRIQGPPLAQAPLTAGCTLLRSQAWLSTTPG